MILSSSETTLRPWKPGTFRLCHFADHAAPCVSQICVTAAFWATDAFLSSRSNFWRSQGFAPAPTGDSLSVRKYGPGNQGLFDSVFLQTPVSRTCLRSASRVHSPCYNTCYDFRYLVRVFFLHTSFHFFLYALLSGRSGVGLVRRKK